MKSIKSAFPFLLAILCIIGGSYHLYQEFISLNSEDLSYDMVSSWEEHMKLIREYLPPDVFIPKDTDQDRSAYEDGKNKDHQGDARNPQGLDVVFSGGDGDGNIPELQSVFGEEVHGKGREHGQHHCADNNQQVKGAFLADFLPTVAAEQEEDRPRQTDEAERS